MYINVIILAWWYAHIETMIYSVQLFNIAVYTLHW